VSYYIDLGFSGLVFGCMYAMMAVGLTLVYGLLRILHIAHAAVYTFGAYVAVIMANGTGNIGVGLLAAVIVAPLFGMAIYRLLYQPLLEYPPYVAMIASIGLLIFMEDGFRIAFGEQGLTFAHNPYPTRLYNFAGLTVNSVQIAIIVCAVACLTMLGLFTTQTRIGIGWRATVSDPRIATSFGVDAVKVRYLIFAIGSALAALGGALVGLLDNFVEPTMGFVVSYKALAIIVLGGLGSLRGTLLASLVLGVVESYGTIFVGRYLDRDAIAFLFLIAVLIVSPRGFGGVKAG
jgi:branched-chain amino acid transport system permease protein